MRSWIKKNFMVMVFTILLAVFSFLVTDMVTLPVYGQIIICGTSRCLCVCSSQDQCYCRVERWSYCECWCDNLSDWDICVL